jgi:hypothetical protein
MMDLWQKGDGANYEYQAFGSYELCRLSLFARPCRISNRDFGFA